MGWRWYEPLTGRFLTPDPVRGGDPLTINPYPFAIGNPIGLVDPLGLSPKKKIQKFVDDTYWGLKPDEWADALDDTGGAFEKLTEQLLEAVKAAYKTKDLKKTGNAAKRFLKFKGADKVLGKLGKVGNLVGKVLTLWEAWNDPNVSTTVGKGVEAEVSVTTEFAIDAAEDANPLFKIFNDLSSIVDNGVALTNTYFEMEIEQPKAADVVKNTGRSPAPLRTGLPAATPMRWTDSPMT